MPMDEEKANAFSAGLKGSTGLLGLKKMFGYGDEEPMKKALNNRLKTAKAERKEDVQPVSEY